MKWSMVSFDASEIVNWSDMPNASDKLPELVRRLALGTATISQIDMPSGSSVRLPGWDGLITAETGNPWVPVGHSGWELSCDKVPGPKATGDYDKRTADPLEVDVANATFVFVTSRRWSRKREWARERRETGPWAEVRAFDADDLVAWLEQAPEVAGWFAGVIGNGSPALEEILEIVTHQGGLNAEAKRETLHHMDDGFADLKAHITSLFPSNPAALGEQADPEQYSDPAMRALARRIDDARDLIGKNMVRTARVLLEQMHNETDTLPAELEFRIITNLAVCALANDDFDRTRILLEEAHELQPESVKAITNAGLAAQLAKDLGYAIQLANRARDLEPENSQATAILMQTLWEMGTTAQLEDLLAAEEWITRDRECVSVLATIRQQQSRFDDATILFRSLIEEDPEDPYSHLGLSQCLISHSQTDYGLGLHTGDIFSRLREAECEATIAINLLRTTELDTQFENALSTRACARALLGAQTESMEDLDEVLRRSPNHPAAAFNRGLLLRSMGRVAEARTVLENIQDPERRANAVLPLAEICLASGDGTTAIELLRDAYQLDDPGWDDVQRAEILCRAEALAIGTSSIWRPLETALERDPENSRLLTLRGICCSILGDPADAEDAFLQALDHAGERDRPQAMARLGFYYQYQERFSEAADCFAETVGEVASDPLAISLMICLANGQRLREALHWARKIKATHRQAPIPALEAEAEILGHIGDARAAVSCYQDLCDHPDAKPADRVTLAMALLRCGDREAALETISSVEMPQLHGAPRSMLQVAQVKWFLGTEDYLEDAYLARRYGTNEADVHLGYIQLVLSREGDLAVPETAGPGCAVLLKEEGIERWWHILDDGEEVRGQREIKSNDELGQLLLGRRTGDVIDLPQAIGRRRYEIAAVQSKFVRAFQETVEEFPTRFPKDMSLSTFTVEDDDLTNLIEFAGARATFARDAQSLYRDGPLPLATFASLVGRSTLEAWRWNTTERSGRIRFGMGTMEETNQATSLVSSAESLVLDMSALLTVLELGIVQDLRSRFPYIAVPQQVVDELHMTLFNMEKMAPSGYLGTDDDGKGMLTEVSEKAWADWVDFVRSVLSLAESFERIASYPLLDTDDSAQYFKTLTPAGAGAVFAGDENPTRRLLLVSDDLALSSVARGYGVDAANTQAVLEELKRLDAITEEKYSSSIERLARLNYWFVRVNADDIMRRLEANGYVTEDGISAMFATLEGPDCTEDSAVFVTTEVITGLADKVDHGQLELILSMALASLRCGRMARPVLNKFRTSISSKLALHPWALNRILRTVDAHIYTFSLIV